MACRFQFKLWQLFIATALLAAVCAAIRWVGGTPMQYILFAVIGCLTGFGASMMLPGKEGGYLMAVLYALLGALLGWLVCPPVIHT